MDKRLIIKKRNELPVARMFGTLSDDSINKLIDNFHKEPETIDTSVRFEKGLAMDKSKTENYSQYKIQYKRDHTLTNIDENYNITPSHLVSVETELKQILSAEVYRMRYATIFSNDHLDWHIDSPSIDRFTVVLQGNQYFNIKSKYGICKIDMKLGDVWYVNSNWPHMVENYGIEERIGLLGCFHYQKN